MAFITLRNLYYILSISVASRVLIFIIQLVSNELVTDHPADAYRNRYHTALTTNFTARNNHYYWYLYKSIEGFTKWDAQYFLEISIDGYISEQHLAFLPLLPLTISFARQITFDSSSEPLERYIQSALVGYTLNNYVFFPSSAIALFLLTKLVKKCSDKYAKNVVWWFCFNPASIFFSACYTESLFAALTFSTMFMLEYSAEKFRSTQDNIAKGAFIPLSQLNIYLQTSLPCLTLLTLSTATRSNGLITIGFLIYQFLLKHAPLRATLECLRDALVLIMSAIVAASGYISFQIYSYSRSCLNGYKADWCRKLLPHPYSQIQAKYWNVGFLNYYQLKQLPNFLLAFPIAYLVLVESIKKTGDSKRYLVYYLQGIILTLFCALCINVQVTTRLLASSCPVMYWICADLRKEIGRRYRTVIVYFFSYYVLGTALHSNFYPWT